MRVSVLTVEYMVHMDAPTAGLLCSIKNKCRIDKIDRTNDNKTAGFCPRKGMPLPPQDAAGCRRNTRFNPVKRRAKLFLQMRLHAPKNGVKIPAIAGIHLGEIPAFFCLGHADARRQLCRPVSTRYQGLPLCFRQKNVIPLLP